VDELLKIAITTPIPVPHEGDRITSLLALGWDRVHLRYPALTVNQVAEIIKAVPEEFHPRLRLHGQFELAGRFNIGGVQLNSRSPEPPPGFAGALSRSCHSVEEVIEAKCDGRFDCVTLSPIFPSISKSGYTPSLTREQMTSAVSAMPVIALGGVSAGNIHMVREMGFAGYAVLGALASARTEEELKTITNTLFKI
jgi:thiamine-phosphate pyrophosphorylase